MNCDDLPPLMEAYLDSELDTRSVAEVSAHLGNCPDCAALFGRAQCGNDRLQDFFKPPTRPDQVLWKAIEDHLHSESSAKPVPVPRISRRAMVVTATMVALAAVAAYPFFLPDEFATVPSIGLVDAMRADHEEFLAGEFGPAFVGDPPAHVLAAARGRLDAAAFTALPSPAISPPGGSRLCHLGGVPVAWTLIHVGGKPVSWVALRREELVHFPDLRGELAPGARSIIRSAGRYRFAARSHGDHIICAVGEASASDLEALLDAVPAS